MEDTNQPPDSEWVFNDSVAPKVSGGSSLVVNLTFKIPTSIKEIADADDIVSGILSDFGKDYLVGGNVGIIQGK